MGIIISPPFARLSGFKLILPSVSSFILNAILLNIDCFRNSAPNVPNWESLSIPTLTSVLFISVVAASNPVISPIISKTCVAGPPKFNLPFTSK